MEEIELYSTTGDAVLYSSPLVKQVRQDMIKMKAYLKEHWYIGQLKTTRVRREKALEKIGKAIKKCEKYGFDNWLVDTYDDLSYFVGKSVSLNNNKDDQYAALLRDTDQKIKRGIIKLNVFKIKKIMDYNRELEKRNFLLEEEIKIIKGQTKEIQKQSKDIHDIASLLQSIALSFSKNTTDPEEKIKRQVISDLEIPKVKAIHFPSLDIAQNNAKPARLANHSSTPPPAGKCPKKALKKAL